MPKRRTTILGLGALAMGSGAAFTSATFQNSVDADADFRVRVDQALVVEAGAAFNDDGSVASSNNELFIDPDNTGDPVGSDFYASDSDLGSVFDADGQDEDLPLATVSKRNETNNGSLETYAAVDFLDVDGANGETVIFEDILQIRNESGHTVEVGIAYDRTESAPGQYGNDVGEGDGEVSFDTVQDVYQFKVDSNSVSTRNRNDEEGGDLISPSSNELGVEDGESTIHKNEDKPANVVEIGSGETVQIDLEIIINETIRGKIRSAANAPGPKKFGEAQDLVDLLDEITVGTVSGE